MKAYLKKEGFRWLYALLLTIVGILIFSFMLDCLLFLISGGWQFPIDTVFSEGEIVYGDLGSWPIVSGTVQRSLTAPWSAQVSFLLILAGLTRVIMGNRPLFFEKRENDAYP